MSSARGEIKVAILAAGEGSRLQRGEAALPKPCVPLRGGTIAGWNLRSFVSAGLRCFVVILGASANRVRHLYEDLASRLGCRVQFIMAEGWQRGNGVSALAAANHLSGRAFLLSMSDHLFSVDLVEWVLSNPPSPGYVHLAIDRALDPAVDLDDLTKVRVDNGSVVVIGKDLQHWDAGDVGLFYCTDVLARGLERAQAQGGYSLTDGVRECARHRRLLTIDIAGTHQWIDIDTPTDLDEAERTSADWLPHPASGPSKNGI